MNKKALYESIMRNVAKQVKKALNESYDEEKGKVSGKQKELIENLFDAIANERPDIFYMGCPITLNDLILYSGEQDSPSNPDELEEWIDAIWAPIGYNNYEYILEELDKNTPANVKKLELLDTLLFDENTQAIVKMMWNNWLNGGDETGNYRGESYGTYDYETGEYEIF